MMVCLRLQEQFLGILTGSILSAFALDLFGFGLYTFPLGAAGAVSFLDPLEGTEISFLELS